MEQYTSKAIIKTISATSRASVKVQTRSGDSFFTVEYHEERALPEVPGIDIEEERKILWDIVNAECDNQITEAIKTFKK